MSHEPGSQEPTYIYIYRSKGGYDGVLSEKAVNSPTTNSTAHRPPSGDANKKRWKATHARLVPGGVAEQAGLLEFLLVTVVITAAVENEP